MSKSDGAWTASGRQVDPLGVGLDLAFPAMPSETATSYTSRLIRRTRAADPFDFCLDVGLD